MERIGAQLLRGTYMFRYVAADDFGVPENAFNICTFWYIDALASIGRLDEARDLFENMLASAQSTRAALGGHRSRDRRLVGQLPADLQHGGIINAAVRLSRPWEHAL